MGDNKIYKKYNILPAFWEEGNEGWIWINRQGAISSHDSISIKRKEEKIKLYTIVRIIDFNVKKKWLDRHEDLVLADNSIIMSAYYRSKLNLEIGEEVELCIAKVRYQWLAKIFIFAFYHPNDVIKVSAWLGITSVVLGILSILIALLTTL
ncbi:MAG: hypothetical protein ABID45_04475 [Patescibacteria group bacterium]